MKKAKCRSYGSMFSKHPLPRTSCFYSTTPPTSSSPHKPESLLVKKCIFLLQNCGSSKLKLRQIHAFSIRNGVPLNDPDIGKHLIHSLVSLSAPMSYPHNIFSCIRSSNVFTWNTMIRGYAESESSEPALQLYRQMRASCIQPDTHTYPFLLKAVAKLADVRIGEIVHSTVIRNGYDSLAFVQNSLLHMYAACGLVDSAHKAFELMSERDIVAWNSVINGFALNGKPNEALTLFREMGLEGVKPDGYTVLSLLSACAELCALALGRRVHIYMVKVGLTDNLHVNNALLDFYAKCGSIREARKVFDEMKERNAVSWSSLIVGLAVNGFGEEALELFKEMETEELVPSEVTFVGVLYACSHCGMVDEGFSYFKRMKEKYGIVPKIEHHGCIVDLLSRAGLVKEAYQYIRNMPLQPNAVIWRTLLGACAMHGHLTLGEYARAQVLKLEPGYSGDYVLLSNLYASEQRWSDVHVLRRKMLSDGVKKIPGYSLVEFGNHVYEFLMGDRSHPQSDQIYAMLAEITKRLRLEGYAPHTENVLADIEEEEKENALSYHSEKIAVAFMLLKTAPGTPIRIVKNLRICADCHLAIKLTSKVFEREIIVRDQSRFHHFRDGFCSCGDYW
ncbi:pentatricopeptide repeat-containing protein At4g21065 [Gossypium raimondii]|nr:pentatricopeptide repeat-containing protein At4g21065 [Gossypium raimondii]